MNIEKATGLRLLLSDLFFTTAIISGGYYIWLRGGSVFDQGVFSAVSFLFELLIIVSTSFYLFSNLQKIRKKNSISEIRSVAGSIDVFLIIENKNIDAVTATLESINALNTNMPVYKFIICESCTDEIEIFATENKCRVLKDDPKQPFGAEGIRLAFMKSEAKYLVFVKSGTKLTENFISKTIPHFIDGSVCMVQAARKISFERKFELTSLLGFSAKIFSLLGIKSAKLDTLSDDSLAYSQDYLSGKKFSLAEWNGVIIEKDSFTRYLPELVPEIEDDMSIFEDIDDDDAGFESTSDDDDEDFSQKVSDKSSSGDEEVLVDEEGAVEEDNLFDENPEDEDVPEKTFEEDENLADEQEGESGNEEDENIDDEPLDDIDPEDDEEQEEETETEDVDTDDEKPDETADEEDEPDEEADDETEPEEEIEDQTPDEVETEQEETETNGDDDNDDENDDEEDDDDDEDEDDELEDNKKAKDSVESSSREAVIPPQLPEDLLFSLRIFSNKEAKAVLLHDQLIDKSVKTSIHNRILFDVTFFRKIIAALQYLKSNKTKNRDPEITKQLRGTFAGFLAQILVYFWGIYIMIATALQIEVISENSFLMILPAILMFFASLEIRSSLLYGSEGFLTKVKRVILAPYYLGIIRIDHDKENNSYEVEKMMGYIRYLLISLNITAIAVTIIKIFYYYEPRLNIAVLVFLLFFLFVLFSSLLFFYTLSQKDELVKE